MKKHKNGKALCKDEVAEGIMKSEGELVIDLIWKLCNIAF